MGDEDIYDVSDELLNQAKEQGLFKSLYKDKINNIKLQGVLKIMISFICLLTRLLVNIT